jgi:hypothetical protein
MNVTDLMWYVNRSECGGDGGRGTGFITETTVTTEVDGKVWAEAAREAGRTPAMAAMGRRHGSRGPGIRSHADFLSCF